MSDSLSLLYANLPFNPNTVPATGATYVSVHIASIHDATSSHCPVDTDQDDRIDPWSRVRILPRGATSCPSSWAESSPVARPLATVPVFVSYALRGTLLCASMSDRSCRGSSTLMAPSSRFPITVFTVVYPSQTTRVSSASITTGSPFTALMSRVDNVAISCITLLSNQHCRSRAWTPSSVMSLVHSRSERCLCGRPKTISLP